MSGSAAPTIDSDKVARLFSALGRLRTRVDLYGEQGLDLPLRQRCARMMSTPKGDYHAIEVLTDILRLVEEIEREEGAA